MLGRATKNIVKYYCPSGITFIPTMSRFGGVDHRLHLALLPSAGMGHLIPFLRLASTLIHHHCRVTLITTHPTISLSESKLISRFTSSFPQLNVEQFNLLPLDPATANSTDPFFLQFETIRRSAHLLRPLLSSVHPPLSALVSDVTLITPVIPVTVALGLPNYVLFTSSARMFSVFVYFSNFVSSSRFLEIPGIRAVPRSSVPPLLLDPGNVFSNMFVEDGPNVKKLHGVLINTFEGLEGEAIAALNGGKVMDGLPPVFALGPFVPCEFERGELEGGAPLMKWLQDEPPDSVVFVSFGSRTTMERAQMRELGDGLVRSGFKFIWVVKDKKVDREEEEDGVEEVLGHELMERVKDKGMVVKSWVDQVEILRHKSVGGFVSHCGWNSVVEAAVHGVRVLAWPQHGDQKVNAEVVEMSGMGMWVEAWGWPGEVLVKGVEIGERVKEMMGSEEMKVKATLVGDEARKALEHGDFHNMLTAFMELANNQN